jgi:Domain of Unknown Function (DUF1080)
MKIKNFWFIFLIIGCSQNNSSTVQQTQPPVEAEAYTESVMVPAPAASPGGRLRIDFEEAAAGALPAGWSAHKTGRGEEIKWAVVVDGSNKVLAQLATTNPNSHFNVVTLDSISAKNVQLKTRFKSISGRMDQGGGFVWRYKNPESYYIVRANSLEDNVVLYKVQNGKRTDLPLIGKGRTYGADAKVPTKTWNELALDARGDLFIVSVNGKELFRVKDTTFPNAGKVGYWTKSDAVTYFDDLEINVLP